MGLACTAPKKEPDPVVTQSPDASVDLDAGGSSDASGADAALSDASSPDSGGTSSGGGLRGLTLRTFASDVKPLLERGRCSACHAGTQPLVNFMAVLNDADGGVDLHESILAYRLAGGQPYLLNFTTPAQSILLSKGAHVGAALTTDPTERNKVIAWVQYERAAACLEHTYDCSPHDAGEPPDAALPPPPFDAGNSPARTVSRAYFRDNVKPVLQDQGCVYCHSGTAAARDNVAYLDHLGPATDYDSFISYVSHTAANLYDFSMPLQSLLLTKGYHRGEPYGRSDNDRANFVTWVALENSAQHAPPDDLDGGVALDAAVISPGGSRDASVERAAAREAFFSNIYTNLTPPTRSDAVCVSCHVTGRGPSAFMLRAGGGGTLPEERYNFIRSNGTLVNLQVPSASLLLLKDEAHEGGQGYMRPNNRDGDRAAFLSWVALERAALDAELGTGGPREVGRGCQTQFYPAVPPLDRPVGAETQINIATQLCLPELDGVLATLVGTRFGTGLEFSFLSIITPPGLTLRVSQPYFTRWHRIDDADGGAVFVPEDVVDVAPGFSALLPPNSYNSITTTPGVIMPGFFGLDGNPNAGGLRSYLSVEFGFIGAERPATDGGMVQDAGMDVLTPCTSLATFTTAVMPRLSNPAAAGQASCLDCHGTTGFVLPRSKMDLSALATDTAGACAQVRRWVDPVNPAQSILLSDVNPLSTGNAHGWWFPSTTMDFDAFAAAVTPWIQSEVL